MDNVTIYRIVLQDNRGCAPIAAIAESVEGVWFNAVARYDGQHDLVFLELPAENASYLNDLLDADDNVISYEETHDRRYFRACYYVAEDGQSDVLLTSEDHAHLPDDELIEEAVKAAYAAGLIGDEAPKIAEGDLREGLRIGDHAPRGARHQRIIN